MQKFLSDGSVYAATIDGVDYLAVPEVKGCIGCAARGGTQLCLLLNDCDNRIFKKRTPEVEREHIIFMLERS